MNIIIYGATELGCLIATEFFEDHDITIIDKEGKLTNNFSRLDIGFIIGNATDIDVLKSANISDADLFLACSESDEINIISCLTAKRVSNIKTVCFVRKEEYKSSLGVAKEDEFISNCYIDEVIWAEELLTQSIFRTITVSEALDVENFANGKARLLEYKIKENSILVDKKVKDCNFPKNTLIVGISKNSDLLLPSGDTILEKDDKVIFMGLASSLDELAGRFFHDKGLAKKVTVVGGGIVGAKLADRLEKANWNVKIIEKNTSRCEILASELNDTLVINGDGTDMALFEEESISDSDVVVSVTNSDEKNLLCSLLAKQLGVKRVITRVSKNANIPLFEKVGIDIAVSAKNAALNEVKNSLPNEKIDILATVEQGKGEILEIELSSDYVKRYVKDLNMPEKAIVGVIQRKNNVIIPKGDTVILPKDNLIIFTTSENAQLIREYFKVQQ